MPVWVGSLDLAKTFDRMNWTQLRGALETNCDSNFERLFLQFISTPVFPFFLHLCMPLCKKTVNTLGINTRFSLRQHRLQMHRYHPTTLDTPNLLPVQTLNADDILIFRRGADEVLFVLHSLMEALAEVEVILNIFGSGHKMT